MKYIYINSPKIRFFVFLQCRLLSNEDLLAPPAHLSTEHLSDLFLSQLDIALREVCIYTTLYIFEWAWVYL